MPCAHPARLFLKATFIASSLVKGTRAKAEQTWLCLSVHA